MHVDRRDICSRHASPGFSRVARHDVPAGKAVWHPGRVSQQQKKRNRLTIRKGWMNTQVNMALTKKSGVEGVIITRYCTLYFVCEYVQVPRLLGSLFSWRLF